jgi:hypothetical protein
MGYYRVRVIGIVRRQITVRAYDYDDACDLACKIAKRELAGLDDSGNPSVEADVAEQMHTENGLDYESESDWQMPEGPQG